ncbi:MAG: hypothetical protein Q8N83_12855 [Ignavibacteria bacterium]|nr:hypothetical protein [Ignavibacteria bacterium]
MNNEKTRTVFLYKDYFTHFYDRQKQKVKDKIIWTFKLIETIRQVPEDYLKHIEGTEGLYTVSKYILCWMARIFFRQVSRNVRKESATSAKGKFIASVAVRGELSEIKDGTNVPSSSKMSLACTVYEFIIR